MENTAFIEQVAEELDSRGYKTTQHTVTKVNGSHAAISLVPDGGDGASPTFYDYMFADMDKQGMGIADMADQMLQASYMAPSFGDISANLNNPEYVLSNVQTCLCNENWNQAFLDKTPHEHIEGTDLAAYPRIWVDGNSSVVPTKELLGTLGISEGDLLRAAKDNSRSDGFTVRSMSEVMGELMGMDMPYDNHMLVLGNSSNRYGASALTDTQTLEKARDIIGSDSIMLIPSSVHELIAVPADGMSAQELSEMIVSINDTAVTDAERLGEAPYRYDGKSLSMDKAPVQEEKRSGRAR